MALILAVEPDRRRSRQLASLVRRFTTAEIVVAQSSAAAISAIGARVPDLILTPALLPTQDETALTVWLRDLGDAAAHVQTVAVPILAETDSGPREPGGSGSILGKLLDRGESPASSHGCDPSVFADQIKVYLERAATDRVARTHGAAPAPVAHAQTAPEPVPPVHASRVPEIPSEPETRKVSNDDFDFEEISLDSLVLEPLFIDSPAGTGEQRRELDTPAAGEPGPPARDTMSAEPATAPPAPAPRPPVDRAAVRVWEKELGITSGSATSPALWRVSEGLPDEPADDPVYEATSVPDAVASAPAIDVEVSVAPKKNKKGQPRTDAPPADDWAFFDPSQTRFKALVRRLDEVVAQQSLHA